MESRRFRFRFRFGLFEFDATTRELRREGRLVRLQSQPGQVLAFLIEHADQVVSREALRTVVWGEATFVDFDRGLNFCISQIRSALRDDSAEPTYIRTIPKQGYQFIAPVERMVSPETETQESKPATRRPSAGRIAVLASAVCVFAALAFVVIRWSRARLVSVPPPIVAVARFDNETGNPEMARFSDGLTDSVVEQLTSLGNNRYSVIGNAQILRLPRKDLDLKAVAASLRASYIVLGQVESNGAQTRIFAHLIRLPDQTHMRVVRMDRPLTDPLSVQSEMAQKIATEFSQRILTDPSHGALPNSASH